MQAACYSSVKLDQPYSSWRTDIEICLSITVAVLVGNWGGQGRLRVALLYLWRYQFLCLCEIRYCCLSNVSRQREAKSESSHCTYAVCRAASSSCFFPGEDTAMAEQRSDGTSPAVKVFVQCLLLFLGTDCNASINKARNILQKPFGFVTGVVTFQPQICSVSFHLTDEISNQFFLCFLQQTNTKD